MSFVTRAYVEASLQQAVVVCGCGNPLELHGWIVHEDGRRELKECPKPKGKILVREGGFAFPDFKVLRLPRRGIQIARKKMSERTTFHIEELRGAWASLPSNWDKARLSDLLFRAETKWNERWMDAHEGEAQTAHQDKQLAEKDLLRVCYDQKEIELVRAFWNALGG